MEKHSKKGNLDELTGLMSYSHFRVEIDKIISYPDTLTSKAFVYFNIENFKNYNEKYGIEAGDNCLRTVARAIEVTFADSINAYMGMDHFCAFTDREKLEERIIEVCEVIYPLKNDTHMRLCAGIYLPNDSSVSPNAAVDRAKMACDSIRNQYDCIYGYYNDDLSLVYQREHFIIDHFEDAIRSEYIQVWYQPIIRSITEEICGYEALARWLDPEAGLISPSYFVPILEKYHMIKKLDLEILEQVCRHQLIIRQQKLIPTAVSINLSRQDFSSESIVEEFDAIVKSFNLQPDLFHVEITESILASDIQNMKHIIDKFQSLGYQVWMDDFGSGYSSLNTLKTYSFDCLKLDMNFLSDFKENSASATILKSIINMSKKLEIQTLAEGVATIEARDFLRNLGCEQMQGFLYSPAVSFNDTSRLPYRQEVPGLRKYYRNIGKINLLSQNPLKKDLDDESVYGIPTAIIELYDNHISYLAINNYYQKFLNTIGIKSIAEAESFINFTPESLPSLFMSTILASKASGKLESFDYVKNGQNCNFQVRPIDSYKDRSAYLVISMNLSHYSQMSRFRLLEDMDESMKGIPHNPAFLWLSGRALSNILGYSSYTDFLASSFYFEVNLTHNQIIDHNFESSNILSDHYYQRMVNDYDLLINNLLSSTVTFDNLKLTQNFYSRENLIHEFNAGNNVGTIEYKSYIYGEPHWLHSTYQLTRSAVTGEILAYFLTYDVEKYRRRIDEAKNAAETDQLTGLYNRYRAVPMIRNYLHKHSDEMCALVMLDLDDFKEVNDQYGHQCGDEMLKAFASRLKSKFSLYGFACRLGGDEFMGIIKRRSRDFVEFFINDMLSKPIRINFEGHEICCTVSAGYVMFPDQGTGYHDLYRMADSAMYNAKRRGKNCFAQYAANNDMSHKIQLSFRSDEIFNAIPGALIVCAADDNLTMITANVDFIHLCGCSSIDELKERYRNSYLNVIAEENRDYVLNKTVTTVTNDISRDFEIVYDIMTVQKRLLCIRATGRCIQNSQGKILYIFIREI